MSKKTHKKRKFSKKVFASYLALSFFFASFFIVIVYFGLNREITRYTNIINTVAIKQNSNKVKVTFDSVKKKIKEYPEYGSKYGNVIIPKINLQLPLYYGDNLEILSYGIGHYAGSYFPGELGTVILAGHNDPGYLDKLPNLEIGDIIVIETNYGKFEYSAEEINIVKENDTQAFKINEEEEVLIYTCYPIGIGHKSERFIVRAKRVGEYYE